MLHLRSASRAPSSTMFKDGELTALLVGLSAIPETDRSAGAEKNFIFPTAVQTAVQNVSGVSRSVTVRLLRKAGVRLTVHTNSDAPITVTVTEPDEDTISAGRTTQSLSTSKCPVNID